MQFTILNRILFSIPLLGLLLINLSFFFSKRGIRLMVGTIVVGLLLPWFFFRYTYFTHMWEHHHNKDMTDTVYESLEWHGFAPEILLKDLMFVEGGLNRTLQQHTDSFVRNRCALLLGMRTNTHNFAPLEHALSDQEFYVRLAAAFAIWKHNYSEITRNGITGTITEQSFLTYLNTATIPELHKLDNSEERRILERFVEQVKKDFVREEATF